MSELWRGKGYSEEKIEQLLKEKKEEYVKEADKIAHEHIKASIGKSKGLPHLCENLEALNADTLSSKT